jgi:hypothetical protein
VLLIKIDVESSKTHFDGLGKILDSPSTPNILEVAVFENDTVNAKGLTVKRPLALKKVWVKPGKSTYTFTTNKLPVKAGIDPYNKMIDRIPDDNVIAVEEEE